MDVIDAIRSFVAVVESGTFTAAARRLSRPNKAVSKHVVELEQRLNLRLLNRTTRSCSLTEAGARYYEGCTELLARFEELESGLTDDNKSLRGHLKVSAPVTYGEAMLVPLLPKFCSLHPEVTVELEMTDRYVDLAKEGVDVAVRMGALDSSRLVAKQLGSAEAWTVASPSYLDAKGTPTIPEDLRGHECIWDSNFRGGARWPYQTNGTPSSVTVKGRVRVNSARAVRDLATSGAGVGFCPSYIVDGAVQDGQLVRLLRPHEALMLDVHGVYLTARGLAPKARAWLDFLATWLSR